MSWLLSNFFFFLHILHFVNAMSLIITYFLNAYIFILTAKRSFFQNKIISTKKNVPKNLSSFNKSTNLKKFYYFVSLVTGYALKLHCDERFTHAFTACGCFFKEITLVDPNQDNYFENATACSKRMRKTLVATQLYSLRVRSVWSNQGVLYSYLRYKVKSA